MAFKPKATLTIGKDKKIIIPRPPNHSTHVYLKVGNRKAIVPIKDFDVLLGVDGWFHYLRQDNKGKITQEDDQESYWNGRNVEGIEELIKKDQSILNKAALLIWVLVILMAFLGELKPL